MTDFLSDDVADVVVRASDRITASDYPAVLASIGDDLRLVLNLDCDRYILQDRRSASDGETIWMSSRRGCKSLSDLLAKFSPSVLGLAVACDGLPDDPSEAFPAFSSARRELLAGFDANRWALDDYGRVMVRDGNMRLVVEPSGLLYRLQRINRDDFLFNKSPDWITCFISRDTKAILAFIEVRVQNTQNWSLPPCPDLVRGICRLPHLASDGVWPVLPPRPE